MWLKKGKGQNQLLDGKINLRQAHIYARAAHFAEMRGVCLQLIERSARDDAALLDIGVLLADYGFLADARYCYELVLGLNPEDLRAQVNLANIARDAGAHGEASCRYAELLQRLPEHPVIRRNALTGLEYNPDALDVERVARAKSWGAWAASRAGGTRPRPAMLALDGRPLRIGYVSADLCQHTVGLFVKDVLKAHDSQRVTIFAYSASPIKDWVSEEIGAACQFRSISSMDDSALSDLIRRDGIDVLVDLSGHTAGSRLTAFAHRPAPVMVSWLGYFATTGLPCMDAVLLDEWHAPAGTEAQFLERIVRLPGGRFCYQHVPWAPMEVQPQPFDHNRYITFGCFNNTAKFNGGVFDVWAKVLAAVPDSRLVLKWRTFNDATFRQTVTDAFVRRGIAAERVELRGPCFHVDLLKEYADIDIALDPFPFNGGLTSCEALWMGVPVVTWPQGRVVSRQTFAFLSAIGLPELAAKNAGDYVRIAAELASDWGQLTTLRQTMRDRMRASPLMDVAGFTHQLEDSLIELYRHIEVEESTKT